MTTQTTAKLGAPSEDDLFRQGDRAAGFRWAICDASGPETAEGLSRAAHLLDLMSRDREPPINNVGFAELMNDLRRAEATAHQHLPPVFSHDEIRRGFRALAAQLRYLHHDPARRAAWGDVIADRRAEARIFRNLLHNADLESGLRRRAAARRQAIVAELARIGQTLHPRPGEPAGGASN